MIAGEPISESLTAWTPDRREPPSPLFFVLAKKTPDTATITGLRLQNLDAFLEKFPEASFLLPVSQGAFEEQFKYSVVALGETAQEVTVHYAQGNDYHSLSVYRVEGRRIFPLYHRWGGGPGGALRFMMTVFPACLFLSWLICFSARVLRKKLERNEILFPLKGAHWHL
jgi:hypothetical protein